MSAVRPVTAAQLAELIDTGTPVLIDFWATWCGPCRQLAPVLDRLAVELAGQVLVVKVDIDVEQGLVSRYGVSSVPTVVLVRNGEVIWRTSGAKPLPALRTDITAALS